MWRGSSTSRGDGFETIGGSRVSLTRSDCLHVCLSSKKGVENGQGSCILPSMDSAIWQLRPDPLPMATEEMPS